MLTIQPRTQASRVIGAIGALFAWTAVILQFILILQNSPESISETIIRFFSYYTILTNILVASCFTAISIRGTSGKQTFFTDPSVLAATAVYISIVGGIYNLVLRGLWTPTGLQFLVDELLHTVIPLFYLAFWFLVAVKRSFPWRSAFVWLLYPLGYFVVILIRGAVSGFYPYPFIDVPELGFTQVILNSVFITGAFMVLSLLMILLSRILRRH